jgi:hypothetical protein
MRLVRVVAVLALAAGAALALVLHNQDQGAEAPGGTEPPGLPQPLGASPLAKSAPALQEPTQAASPPKLTAQPLASPAQTLVPLTLECTEDGKCGDCRTAAGCAPGQGCVLDYTARKFFCLNSDCKTDDDCAEGQVCLRYSSAKGSSIRRCAEAGILAEGADCSDSTAPPEGRCALGLVCVLTRCGRQCNPKPNAPCSGKERCITVQGEGAGCFPSCSNNADCEGGKVCLGHGLPVPTCVQLLGPDCDTSRCLPPSTCEASIGNGAATSECVKPCNPSLADPTCPDGFVCGTLGARSRCYQRCTSSANDCPPGRSCVPVGEDGTQFGCISSTWIRHILVHP